MRTRDKHILREYLARVPVAVIARKRKVHRSTIYRIVAQYKPAAGA